ncbi:MAG: DUF3466 family protein [Rhizonema sp. NSF051]|nr:DUF3466 family protein [Rhizonema sp. NSF051]
MRNILSNLKSADCLHVSFAKSFSVPTNIKTRKNKLGLNFGKIGCAIAVLSIAGIATSTSSQVIAASAYVITDLGNFSSDSTDIRANAINNSGQVVGREVGADQANHGFVWDRGKISQLPELGYVDAVARSINDSGTIAGTVDSVIGRDQEQGFIWTKNASRGYSGAYYGEDNVVEKYFRDINNKNQVAGEYIDARTVPGVASVPGFPVPRPSRAFYWSKGVVTELPTLGGIIGAARSINDKSELVGNVATGADQTTVTAALWRKDKNGKFALQNLGTFGGLQSLALAINNASQVVGQYLPEANKSIPFIWENGNETDLGSLGGSLGNALSINNLTQVVGFSNTAKNAITGQEVSHAFIWEDGQISDLNSLLVGGSGWELTQATGINDFGQIVGYGSYTNNLGQKQTRAFILQPVPESGAALSGKKKPKKELRYISN